MAQVSVTAGNRHSNALLGRTIRKDFRSENVCFRVCDFAWNRVFTDVWDIDAHVISFVLSSNPHPRADPEPRPQTNPAGQIMFYPAGRSYMSEAGIGTARTMTCIFPAEAMEGLLGMAPPWSSHTEEQGALRLGGSEIEHLLLKAYRELNEQGFGMRALLDAIATALAITLIRALSVDRAPDDLPRKGGLASWRLRRIRDRVHVDGPAPSLIELSELCGMSVRHLTRAFKQETGVTVAAFIQELQIERARELLVITKSPVAEIATQLGFSTTSSFCYAFRRFTGQRPSDVRLGQLELDRPRRRRQSAISVRSSHEARTIG